jgi:hypothetical protein
MEEDDARKPAEWREGHAKQAKSWFKGRNCEPARESEDACGLFCYIGGMIRNVSKLDD